MPKRYVSFERMIGNVFFDSQSRFFRFPITFFQTSNPFFVRNPLSLRENGKSLATLQRPRNMLMVINVTVARARNLLSHLPRFPVLVRPVFPSRFHVRCNIPCPCHQTVPGVVASVARESQALATVTPLIANGLGGAVARLQEFPELPV